jgi:hypothetical protein
VAVGPQELQDCVRIAGAIVIVSISVSVAVAGVSVTVSVSVSVAVAVVVAVEPPEQVSAQSPPHSKIVKPRPKRLGLKLNGSVAIVGNGPQAVPARASSEVRSGSDPADEHSSGEQ